MNLSKMPPHPVDLTDYAEDCAVRVSVMIATNSNMISTGSVLTLLKVFTSRVEAKGRQTTAINTLL